MPRSGSAAKQSTKEEERPKLTVVEHKPYADLGEVEEFAEGLSDKYLQCRELGHLWRPTNRAGRIELEGTKEKGWYRQLKCYRCTTKRVQELDHKGMILSNRYIHPEGYLMEGLGRIVGEGRGVLRLASLKRIVKE